MAKWSCDETKGQKHCRNPHGCHCAEIEALQASHAQTKQKVRKALVGIHTFAWSMVHVSGAPARKNLQKRIDLCRSVLSNL